MSSFHATTSHHRDVPYAAGNPDVRELEKVVYRDQNASPPAPALVMLEKDLGAKFDLMALADMTGMALVAAGAKPAGTAGGTGVQLLFGADGKWCSKCPHDPCFLNPLYGTGWRRAAQGR